MMHTEDTVMNLMTLPPKPQVNAGPGDKNLQTFGLIVFLSTASYYCIQVAKVSSLIFNQTLCLFGL
jgi:hypothetical protein